MIMFLFILLTSFTWSAPPPHWSSLLEIKERHEFYQDNEVIIKPRGSWQTLFAVVFPDINLKMNKDCVFYKVPGEEDGVFKLKSITLQETCENFADAKGDFEIFGLKALQFSLNTSRLFIQFTYPDYHTVKWRVPLSNVFNSPQLKLFTSSAEYKAPKVILLSPAKNRSVEVPVVNTNSKTPCHSISDDCEELSPSTCNQCLEGWFEVPNGCPQGPKFCGLEDCGKKNSPACRRGMKYQRERKKFECRVDSSFAYCRPGLQVQCEGGMAYCR